MAPNRIWLRVILLWIVGTFFWGATTNGADGDESVVNVIRSLSDRRPQSPSGKPAPPPSVSGDLESGPTSLFESGDEDEVIPDGQTVNVGSWGQIDLHVKELELSRVLQLLSLQSQRNIVVSKSVIGAISADLYNVDFYEALSAILHINGFGYIEDGNLIRVYTAQEISQIEQERRKLITRVVRLNYLAAVDAETFVTPLLSRAGAITVSGEAGPNVQPSISELGAMTFAFPPTLVIYDYQENVEQMIEVLKQLDVRPKQISIETTILEARLTETNEFGIDLTVLADFAISDFSDPIDLVNDLISGSVDGTGQAISTGVGSTRSAAGIKIGFLGDEFTAFIRALNEITDVTVLGRPKLTVLNGMRAELLVGERLGYLSTQATETSTTQTVEFLNIGTQLTVRPFASDDGSVRLELRPSISDGSTVTVAGGFVIPNTTNEEVLTNVLVPSGKTLVLGGLFKEDTTITRRQVPWFGDIPIVGSAFKGQDDSVTRNEVIFLVRPTILRSKSLSAGADRAMESAELIRIGSRMNLLPWSRSKIVAGHVRDAHRQMESDNRAKALWHVNIALTMDPGLVEAQRIKEKLTGQRTYWPDRSLAEDAVNHMVDDKLGQGAPVEPPSDASTDEHSPPLLHRPAPSPQTATNSLAKSAQPVETDGPTPAVIQTVESDEIDLELID